MRLLRPRLCRDSRLRRSTGGSHDRVSSHVTGLRAHARPRSMRQPTEPSNLFKVPRVVSHQLCASTKSLVLPLLTTIYIPYSVLGLHNIIHVTLCNALHCTFTHSLAPYSVLDWHNIISIIIYMSSFQGRPHFSDKNGLGEQYF